MAESKKTLNLTQNFDFETYYKLIRKAPIGLRLYLAQQLLDNAASRIGRCPKDQGHRYRTSAQMHEHSLSKGPRRRIRGAAPCHVASRIAGDCTTMTLEGDEP